MNIAAVSYHCTFYKHLDYSGSDSHNMIGQLRVSKCGRNVAEGGGYFIIKCQKAGILP